MFNKKVYGQSKTEQCYFCDKNALSKNSQGILVCEKHKNQSVAAKKCICGETLSIKESKWGAFFLCKNCGPISLTKAKQNENLKTSEYNINKKYRQNTKPKPVFDENKIYTLDELEELFDKE